MKPSHLSSRLTSNHKPSLPMSYLKCWGGDFFSVLGNSDCFTAGLLTPNCCNNTEQLLQSFWVFDGVKVSIPGPISLVVAFKVRTVSGAKRENTGPRSHWAKCHTEKPRAQSQHSRSSPISDIVTGLLRERGWLRKGLQDAGWFGWSSDCFLFGVPAGLQLNVDFQRSVDSGVKWGKAWSLNGQECGLQSQWVLLQILVSLLLTRVTASKWMNLWISVSSTVKWDNKSAQLIRGWMRQYMWSAK